MKKAARVLFLLILLVIPRVQDIASASEAEEILAGAHLFGDSPFLEMEVEMRMTDPSGEKTRGIDIRMSKVGNEYRVYMQITSPSFLRKMKFLQHNPENGDTLQWVATSRGARKITSSGEDERIFDSDFTAADFSSISMDEYRIEGFSENDCEGIPCYRFELSPLDQAGEVTKKVLLLDRQSLLIREVQYYTNGEMTRRYRLLSTRSIEGKIFPAKSVMEDLREASSTTLFFKKIELPASIPDRVFHYRNL